MTKKADKQALTQMQKSETGGKWYAYENKALDSVYVGHLKFLLCGSNQTFKTPPHKYPGDWKYYIEGEVDLDSGEILTNHSREADSRM